MTAPAPVAWGAAAATGGGSDLAARIAALRGLEAVPTGVVAQTQPRSMISGSTHQAPASGRLAMYGIWLEAGTVVSSITFTAGTTAGAGLTDTWFALYSPSLALLGVTSDDTSATWTANAAKTLTLASPVTITVSGYYFVGIVCVGTTRPTLIGSTTMPNPLGIIDPAVSGWSTASLTIPSSAPNPAGAVNSQIAGWAWAYVS